MIDLETWICNATVKIKVGNEHGSGFFIPLDGYILTAFHCLHYSPDVIEKKIIVESSLYDQFYAQLDQRKSLRAFDLAVLKINWESEYCLPLGDISRTDLKNSRIVYSTGYPVLDTISGFQEPSFFEGRITNLSEKDILLTGAIGGEGHSGGPVFYTGTKRVIGVAKKIPKDTRRGSDRVARVSKLLEHWPGLKEKNEQFVAKWNQTSQPEKENTEPKTTPQDKNTFSITGQLTCQKLLDAGILEEMAKLFPNRNAARQFLKGQLNYPGGYIPNSEPNVLFWKNICRTIEKGMVQGGVLVLLKKIAQRYPEHVTFQQWL